MPWKYYIQRTWSWIPTQLVKQSIISGRSSSNTALAIFSLTPARYDGAARTPNTVPLHAGAFPPEAVWIHRFNSDPLIANISSYSMNSTGLFRVGVSLLLTGDCVRKLSRSRYQPGVWMKCANPSSLYGTLIRRGVSSLTAKRMTSIVGSGGVGSCCTDAMHADLCLYRSYRSMGTWADAKRAPLQKKYRPACCAELHNRTPRRTYCISCGCFCDRRHKELPIEHLKS